MHCAAAASTAGSLSRALGSRHRHLSGDSPSDTVSRLHTHPRSLHPAVWGQQTRCQSLTSALTLLPAFRENMFTEALGGPPGPGGPACAALGREVGGGGGAFFCGGKAALETCPWARGHQARTDASQAPTATLWGSQLTSSSGSFTSTHRFFFSSQTICHHREKQRERSGDSAEQNWSAAPRDTAHPGDARLGCAVRTTAAGDTVALSHCRRRRPTLRHSLICSCHQADKLLSSSSRAASEIARILRSAHRNNRSGMEGAALGAGSPTRRTSLGGSAHRRGERSEPQTQGTGEGGVRV